MRNRLMVPSLVLGCFLGSWDHSQARGAAKGCPTEKVRFTKETGCRNDGYVEFCLPANDKKARAAVKGIAPNAENKGRQKCGAKSDLFFLPVDVESGTCVERWGAMTDKGWNQVCALARLPQIQGIRHTIFE